jgi:RNA 2',3'-cyclic 3'-phosphodiesterase
MAGAPLNSAILRLFLALSLQDLTEPLSQLIASLRPKISGVKWTDPDQAHLTLHFFGDVVSNEVERIDITMRHVAASFAPLTIKLNGLGVFPNLEKPNVLWGGIQEPAGQLDALAERVRMEVKALGLDVDTRPFHPHVTLGRVKVPQKHFDFKRILTQVPMPISLPVKLDHFCLYQSQLRPEGARYEILQKFFFTKK